MTGNTTYTGAFTRNNTYSTVYRRYVYTTSTTTSSSTYRTLDCSGYAYWAASLRNEKRAQEENREAELQKAFDEVFDG